MPARRRSSLEGNDDIVADAHIGKALRDELTGLRSHRVGRFRIVYRIAPNAVEIVALGPRRIIYEETFRLIKKK